MGEDGSDGRATFDYSSGELDEPALTIVEAVGRITGNERTELDPLESVIDTDALSVLFAGAPGETYGGSARPASTSIAVTFRYEGCVVTVEDGRVRVDGG